MTSNGALSRVCSNPMFALTRHQRNCLDRLCRCIVPAAHSAGVPLIDLPEQVEQRLATVDRDRAADVALLLTLFDHPLTAVLTHGSPTRFSRAEPAERERRLRCWERSRVPVRRTIYQALRRLILSTYYALPESYAGFGFRGPLHRRRVAVDWEGPLEGTLRGDEPILRVADPDAWRAPPPQPATPHRNVVAGHVITGERSLSADVCVVGSGAGGAVMAARLAEAGKDVVVLEEGGYWTPADFTELEGEMMPRLFADQAARSTDDLSVALYQGSCVGGSTTVNWMITLRPPDWVLDEWAADHGTENMGPRDLTPVFDRVEGEIHARLVPDDAHAPGNRLILDGARRLGWDARVAKINALGCVRAGSCSLGCRYGAKQSADVTFIPRALAAGARLFTDARVERVQLVRPSGPTRDKRVTATVIDRDSRAPRGVLHVTAPIVVLAAGAVGTPVILQRSGLGGGGVGRFLRLHPTTAVKGTYDREIYAPAGIPQSALCDHFLDGNGTGYGFWIECPAVTPALAAIANPGFGPAHGEAMEGLNNEAIFIALLRDGIERVRSYGEVTVDRRGRRHIRYRLPAADRHMLGRAIRATAELHLAAGARVVRTIHQPEYSLTGTSDLTGLGARPLTANRIGLFSAHVNGTCRIGRDARTSGCAPDGQRHGVPGLYVADGSLLPTAPGVNPQLTIMALASIIASGVP